ncbi:MAG: RecX family transcriptional regulator [Bacteroidales bacterium]|nr:RecX family transcriptional regulator [Bacteroidales bacterium]
MTSENSKLKNIKIKMAAICSRSEQCSNDILKKIIAAGIDKDDAEEILNQLKKENFINDKRYINSYTAEKFRINRWGKIKIRYYLKQKGLDEQLIEEGLNNIDDEKYREAILKTIKEKAKTVKKQNKYEKMGQIIRFAQSRGFEPELIHRYLSEAID